MGGAVAEQPAGAAANAVLAAAGDFRRLAAWLNSVIAAGELSLDGAAPA